LAGKLVIIRRAPIIEPVKHVGKTACVRAVETGCDAQLAEVISAKHPLSRLPGAVEGRQHQADQHPEDRDHRQEFDERKGRRICWRLDSASLCQWLHGGSDRALLMNRAWEGGSFRKVNSSGTQQLEDGRLLKETVREGRFFVR
jgi:hypothetical protein